MRIEHPIGNGFYQSESLPLSSQTCINWYPHIPQAPALSKASLFACPGIEQVATAGNACRGAHVMDGKPYFVNGSNLYRLNRAQNAQGQTVYSLEDLGTINGTGRVSMADNGTQLVIQVPGGTGYIYNGTSLAAITDGDFDANGNPQYVDFIDGYFVWSTDTKKFIISNINDGFTIDALDFGSAEADPDDIVAPFVFNNQLMMFGSQTYEVFQNIGGNAFPFQRIPGAVLDVGLVAPLSIKRVRGAFMFLGAGESEGAAIFASSGGRPERVSTEPIDSAIQSMPDEDIRDCYSWSYGSKGHYFVGFSFPQRTFVYDLSTGRWHERKSRVDDQQRPYRVAEIVQAYGEVFCGDAFDGRVGVLSDDTFTEYGEPITREATFQPLVADMQDIFVSTFDLAVETGSGSGDVEMRYSKDGFTWSDWHSRSMGALGQYRRKLVWRRLGRFPRFAVFSVRTSSAVKSNLLRLDLDIG